ncbi:MAG: lysophospholipid acyltransferase family protein [Elusimicrobia bacterium]|nr:lysophospholipid acyltransferase family protein [Elusimicrobiota bacterium]
MPNDVSCRVSLKHSTLAWAAAKFLYLVGKTAKIIRQGEPSADRLENGGGNFIYAIWHSQQVFLTYTHRFRKACALVSLSQDGEYMALLLKYFGIEVVRGSTSKGGTQAILRLIEKAEEGFHPVITPDGPRGPRQMVGQGIVFLAQKTGLPVIPVACGVRRKIVFNSWDRFQLPLPFARAAVVYGKPIYVKPDDDGVKKALEIELELNRATATAEKLVLS